jgi:non-heme chloroperoxidase
MKLPAARLKPLFGLALAFFTYSFVCAQETGLTKVTKPVWHDPSPHKVQSVTVEKDVQLEVLDWGGTGRNIVLLGGLGNTAHIFDDFAPKLAIRFHVYGITRRGYGRSSTPATGYSAERLGQDVVAVLDALRIEAPVLVGHSIAGEELSSVASQDPKRIAGLVYLDAANSFAFYDREHGDYLIDLGDLKKKIEELQKSPFDATKMGAVETLLPNFERNLADMQLRSAAASGGPGPTPADMASFPAMRQFMAGVVGGLPPEAEIRETFQETPSGTVGPPRGQGFVPGAIRAGEQKFAEIHCPVLAVFVMHHVHSEIKPENSAKFAVAEANMDASTTMQANAFEKGIPGVHVVRIDHGSHYIFISNQEQIMDLIAKFVDSL